MTGLTLHGIPSPGRLPAIPALDDTLELADAAQRHPSDLSVPEIVKLGAGADHLASELDRIRGERDAALDRVEDLLAEIALLRHGTRIEASYERISFTAVGPSRSVVGERLKAVIDADSVRLADWRSEHDEKRRISPPIPVFDLSDCTDTTVVDVPVVP